jgi:predicted transcriptional regulator
LTNRIFQRRGRDKLHIIAEILETAKDTALKTQIMYRANLSFTQLNDYLSFMLKNELLEKVSLNDREVYKATSKGIEFLQHYREITELLRTEKENVELVHIEHKQKIKRESTK